MTIEIIEGDLLDAFARSHVDTIGHVVNCQGKMNSGIARVIRSNFPKAYSEYMDLYNAIPHDLLGKAQLVDIDWGDFKSIANLFAQEYYGYDGKRYLNYGALGQCFYSLNNRFGTGIIGFPYKMGSDRAGGDWDIVLEMIQFYFKDRDVKIYRLPE